MKAYFKQFLSCSHSWGNVGTSIAKELKNMGHDIELCSTNGYDSFPEELLENVVCRNCTTPQNLSKNVCNINNEFDLSFAYTMMMHFPEYLKHGKNRFGCWNLDGTVIPSGYIKYHAGATKILPSSSFSLNVFKKNGLPEDKMFVIPHGYNENDLKNSKKYELKTDKKIKVLINIQQNHTRKNIKGILDVWGKTFTNIDDVILIAKVKNKVPSALFEVSWNVEFQKFKKKYKKHAPVIIIDEFISNIFDLYNACDIVFSMSNIECFLMPALEGLASNKLVIASGGDTCCGNVDFMNEKNSLLIKGKTVRAPSNYQYWKASVYGEMFEPDKEHASELLLNAVKNYDKLMYNFSDGIKHIKKKYTWNAVTKQILNLCE